MIYQIIAFIILTSLAGIKRPLYGGLAGLLAAPAMSWYFGTDDVPTVLVLGAFGFGFGLICGRISWWLIHASDDEDHKSKPYVMPITKGGGSGQRGHIIYTDEEEKNAEDNEESIR